VLWVIEVKKVNL